MRFSSLAPTLSLAFALLVPLTACGDKSAVSLTVTMQDPSVTAQQGALGSTLGGGFELEFNLGPEASGTTTVTLGDFALQTAAGTMLVDSLKVDPGSTAFPLTIDKGSIKDVSFTFSMSALLTQAQHDAICAGKVVIVGSVMDSLSGHTDSTESAAVTPDCS
ncbi:MAG TPA: hypothetical protein VHV51_00685 [Polyangiaceae bacterium]|jgi:hypothetical protein|nr:hypothetical protein [Polyangiaceae bacterium]